MTTSMARMEHIIDHPIFMKLIAMSEDLGVNWIKVACQMSWSKKCRPFLQCMNEAIASVNKAGSSRADCQVYVQHSEVLTAV